MQSTFLSMTVTTLGAFVRVPLTISALGVVGLGVVSTVVQLYAWLGSMAAGARVAGSSQSSIIGVAALNDPPRVAMAAQKTYVETLHAARWYLLACVAVIIALPSQALIDPSRTYSPVVIKAALLVGIVIAVASCLGGARLGILTTLGSYSEQNSALVSNGILTVLLVLVLWWLDAPWFFFAVIWMMAFAAPAFQSSLRNARQLATRRSWERSEPNPSRSGLWIAVSQQSGSGFDLVMVTAILGSADAALLAVTTRLALLLVSLGIGTTPAITRRAAIAREQQTASARRHCRSLAALVLGLTLLSCILAIWLLPVGVRLLSIGALYLPQGLLFGALAWTAAETVRRIALALTTTSDGLDAWRRVAGVGIALNLTVSLGATWSLGVAGPLIGSIIASLATTGWTVIKHRTLFRSVL